MRLRFTVLATVLSALTFTALTPIAGAAPQRDRGLTIHAVPHSIIAGEAVLIYGRLASHASNQIVRLYHRIVGQPGFSLISVTRTDAASRYEFSRAENVVETNRSWFVRGPVQTHSRTVDERVAALVSLAASSSTGTTRHAITFSGHLTPNHAGSIVLLQVQKGSSDDWRTLKRGLVGPASNYQIAYAWQTAGARELRVLFRGDARNTTSASDPLDVVIGQAEVPGFTIGSRNPIVRDGSPATIWGTLYAPGSTALPQPGTTVQLFGHIPDHGSFRELQSTVTGPAGGYQFTVQRSTNEYYEVRTLTTPRRDTAQLFEGVQDAVTMSASSTTSTVGGHITFTGTVSPDKTGHVIYLQKFGSDGDWHTVETGVVHHGSAFSFGWTFGNAGAKQFRARITGGPNNLGGASPGVTVYAAPTPLSSLPTS
jgi:hypothetical protein